MAGAYSAACVVLFDTAVPVILALAVLAPADIDGTFPVCTYRSRIVGPRHLHFQPLARLAKSVSWWRLDNVCCSCVPSLHVSHWLL
jgi:hypothetical protein